VVELVDLIPELRHDLESVARLDKAPQMKAYMKDRFEFLGVPTPERRRASKPFIAAGRQATADQLLAAADACWAEPEREFQYVAASLLRRWHGSLEPMSLPRVEQLIRTKSWWDTVDSLAGGVVGPLVARNPELTATIDAWIDDPDFWVARTAILHQLGYGADTDADRLFGYVDRRCADTEFFLRKACGWALRQYARHDPEAVRAYVLDRDDRLSGLTRREALKHL
jgi:3-methyladenine DNA glycosylase AlkD